MDTVESLNALYVYEAQMSFLIRVASSRDGAEKLLSAGALSKLAECNYLGSRPNAYEPSLGTPWFARMKVDQTEHFTTDLDGFLPAAKERHHQLLFSALQFIVGTLVSFGYETPVASQQAMAFVFAQRETLLVAIGDCKVHQSIASLKETHLIVTLLSIVLPSVSDGDLVSFLGLWPLNILSH
jgi:nuclear pore complex protein Nup205